jgi:hypothetical protein
MKNATFSDIPFALRKYATVNVCMQGTGLGRSSIYDLIAEGKVQKIKFGKRTLIDIQSLLAALGTDDQAE